MDVGEHTLTGGDILLLSTDGLHDLVGEAAIVKAISTDLDQSARRLVDLANTAGGPDNITVALVRIA
jgi:protein phosphatase